MDPLDGVEGEAAGVTEPIMHASHTADRRRHRRRILLLLLAGMAGGLGLFDTLAPHAPGGGPAHGTNGGATVPAARAFTAIAAPPPAKGARAQGAAPDPQPAAYLALADRSEADGDGGIFTSGASAGNVQFTTADAQPGVARIGDAAPAVAGGSQAGAGIAMPPASPMAAGGGVAVPGAVATTTGSGNGAASATSGSDGDTSGAIVRPGNESKVLLTAPDAPRSSTEPVPAASVADANSAPAGEPTPSAVARSTSTPPDGTTALLRETALAAPSRTPFVTAAQGETSAVPEPASWLTMITGFALVGALQRRARPRAAVRALIPSAAGRR